MPNLQDAHLTIKPWEHWDQSFLGLICPFL